MTDDSVFYYRVQSPVIIVEFDHQRGIALPRAHQALQRSYPLVVRTPNGNDYGKDLLRQHYQSAITRAELIANPPSHCSRRGRPACLPCTDGRPHRVAPNRKLLS